MARHKTSLDDTILSTLQRYEIQICPVYSLLINAKMHDILQNESIVKNHSEKNHKPLPFIFCLLIEMFYLDRFVACKFLLSIKFLFC